jgi:citrate lyase subunit beta/citryl-CoA lyase/(S)-citramalyl-CoA lyase
LNPRRCLLFVPGSRPERFDKALAADADQVCIDLEDAVGPQDKDTARNAAFAYIAGRPPGRSELGLRLNAVGSLAGARDLAALRASSVEPDFVMLPKVESAEELHAVARALGARRSRLVALIESPRGVLDARHIAGATPRLAALMFGGFDYAVALRGRAGWECFFAPRVQLALVAAERELGFIDVPFLDIRDADGLAAETQRVIALGATAKAAIHPDQVAPIQAQFLPTADELTRAQHLLAAVDSARGAAIQVDGKLVDRPIELAARRVVALGQLGVREGGIGKWEVESGK